MIPKEKLEKLHTMSQNLSDSAGDDRRVQNCATIFTLLLNHIDDMVEELEHMKEENEALRFDLDDKKFEEGPRRRNRAEVPAAAPIPAARDIDARRAPRAMPPFSDDDLPF